MKNILILGAYGKIARLVEKRLIDNPEYKLTLVLRNASRLNSLKTTQNTQIIEGNVDEKNF